MTRAADTSRDTDFAGASHSFESPFLHEDLVLRQPSSN